MYRSSRRLSQIETCLKPVSTPRAGRNGPSGVFRHFDVLKGFLMDSLMQRVSWRLLIVENVL